ncbi:hypothetical protein DH09_08205 [Bacillaceae bacterium JMAK1]|nr:hypothetical protein DH09_08205 [Bacillaceae bacterium JMAK1]
MADGRYILRNCVPDGSIDVANIQPGEIIQREWSFRVNMPPDVQEALDNGTLDPRNINRGYDGKLFDEDGNWLAEVNTFHVQMNITNSDYQPAGQKITWAVPMSYTVTLTFTETVVKDAVMLTKVMAGLQNDAPDASLNFQGFIKGRAA